MFSPYSSASVEANGESTTSQHPQRIVLGSSQTSAITDANGLASLATAAGGLNRPLEAAIEARAGLAAVLEFQLQALPKLAPAIPGASNGIPRRSASPVEGHRQPGSVVIEDACDSDEKCPPASIESAIRTEAPPASEPRQPHSFAMTFVEQESFSEECGKVEDSAAKSGADVPAREQISEPKECPTAKSCPCK